MRPSQPFLDALYFYNCGLGRGSLLDARPLILGLSLLLRSMTVISSTSLLSRHYTHVAWYVSGYILITDSHVTLTQTNLCFLCRDGTLLTRQSNATRPLPSSSICTLRLSGSRTRPKRSTVDTPAAFLFCAREIKRGLTG